MSFKKKLIMLCVLVLTLTLCCFGLAACGEGGNEGGDAPNGGQQTEGTPNGGEAGEGESEEPEENIDWTLVYTVNDDGSTITGLTEYGKTLSKIVIPETLNGKTITSIGSSAFSYCTSLTSVTIGSGVTSIGGGAFAGCTSLNSITIPDSVTSIGNSAFYYCESLTSVVIPDSVTSIGSSAFSDCSSLTSVTIGNSVKSIGSSAFSGCKSLTSVTIGSGVTSIGWYAFYNCTLLTSVTFENPNGWSVNGTNLILTNSSTNATYLKDTHYGNYWYRR